MKASYLLPRAKLLRVTFFVKWSYLLPREDFKLPYLPNQTHLEPGICTQLRSNHIHSIHLKSRDFIHGNFAYLAIICAVWSSRGRAGKKVTAVTFFRCPTVFNIIPRNHHSDALMYGRMDEPSYRRWSILCPPSDFVRVDNKKSPADLYFEETRIYIYSFLHFQDGAGSWNPRWLKTVVRWYCISNDMVADDMATQWTRAQTAM